MSTKQTYKPKILHFEDELQMIKSAIALIQEVSDESIYNSGSFRTALAGGKTPVNLYSKFAKMYLNWESVKIYQTDERFVSPKNIESNQLMINTCFDVALEQGLIFIPFDTSNTIEQAVKSYSDELDSLDCPIFDLVILGIGNDGHIASLFPGNDYEQDALVIQTKAPKGYKTKERLSLAPKAILDSKSILLYVVGEDKYEAVEELTNGVKSENDMIAKILLQHPNVQIYFAEEPFVE
jgi:6-phosphogluconolactonase